MGHQQRRDKRFGFKQVEHSVGHNKNVAPSRTAENAEQAQENAGALGWRLTGEESARLAVISDTILE